MITATDATKVPLNVAAPSSALRIRDERLVSLQLMAGQLAHDFNNFLSPVLGYVSLIKEELSPDSPAFQYAVALEKAARKTEASLETILLAARPQRRFRPQPLDFSQLVDRVLSEWSQALPATARITVKKQLDPCLLTLDEAQWQNAVRQLLQNARFALATGGVLKVSLQPETLTADHARALGLAGPRSYCLKIQDNGFGMGAAAMQRAFEPFFTTRPKNQAQGLGLAIVYGIVRLHGGQVVLESTEDVGTTVSIWLPAEESTDASPATLREEPPKKAEAADDKLLGAGKKVLVVDDDAMVIEVVRACLQRARFEVLVARDGQEGLELFQQHGKSLDLVLTDVTMPRLSGIEMVQRIRWIDPAARIILMSGDADATREEKLVALAPQRPPLIKKPFTLKELMAILRAQLA